MASLDGFRTGSILAGLVHDTNLRLRAIDLLAALTAGLGTALLGRIVLRSADLWILLAFPDWWLLLALPLAAVAGITVASSLQARLPVVFEIAKFGLVGILCTSIDLGVLNSLMQATGVFRGSLFPVLKGVSFLSALINAFFWHRLWTFGRQRRRPLRAVHQQFVLFTAAALGGLGLNVTVASLIVNLVAVPAGWQPTQWANFAALTALVATATWDFLCYKFIVFRAREAKGES